MMRVLHQDQLARLLLRLGVGGMMCLHGIAKIGHLAGIEGIVHSHGLPTFIAYGVYVGELVAPVLLIIGFHSRLAGLLIVINMLFALYLVHMNSLLALSSHGGWEIELQVFYLLGGLCIALLGSGKYAIKAD